MTIHLIEKKHLSARGLIKKARDVFKKVKEPVKGDQGKQKEISITDCLSSALAIFKLKFASLLQFEDALSSNGPHLKLLKELNMSFITVVKPDGNKFLFDWVEGFDWSEDLSKRVESQGEFSFVDDKGSTHKFRFVNLVPFNDTHKNLKVNFLEYWEISKEGKPLYHNTWVTDLEITELTTYKIARGGRTRWHIENETFNTLKNQGYHFEHNFGHGYKNLSTVFAMLMMLAFLIDQTKQLCCGLFQGALKQSRSKKSYLWRTIRELFSTHIVPSWEIRYRAIINTNSRKIPVLNTS